MTLPRKDPSFASGDFSHWMLRIQEQIEAALDTRLPSSEIAPANLHRAMRYAALDGGKRVRPLLVFAAGEVGQAPQEALIRAACAVELIHAYSLVHDDLPCMDDDQLRRGKPTVHVAFDEATALLVGDALQSLAFQCLAEDPRGRADSDHCAQTSSQSFLPLVGLLAQASGSRGMAGGQALDIAATGRQIEYSELEFMHIHKTGALIRAAVLMGAHLGRLPPPNAIEHLDHFAKRCGLLFQVVDDVLDAESDTATLGKTAGKDAAQNKVTYVSVLGAKGARELADELLAEALAALAPLGPAAQRLRTLAEFIARRSF